MEEHQEELATIEALDAGAVYTLALKTHVGMSIQTFRYFAGWCDKIQVGTRLPPTAWELTQAGQARQGVPSAVHYAECCVTGLWASCVSVKSGLHASSFLHRTEGCGQ